MESTAHFHVEHQLPWIPSMMATQISKEGLDEDPHRLHLEGARDTNRGAMGGGRRRVIGQRVAEAAVVVVVAAVAALVEAALPVQMEQKGAQRVRSTPSQRSQIFHRLRHRHHLRPRKTLMMLLIKPFASKGFCLRCLAIDRHPTWRR